MKKCCKCLELKPFDDFYNNRIRVDGKHGQCKLCMNSAYKPKTKEQQRRDSKAYAQRNPDKIKKAWNSYYLDNKEKLKEKRKIADQRPERVAKIKDWQTLNKEKILFQKRERRKNPTPHQLIEKILRDRFYKVIIRLKRGSKYCSSISLIGCSLDELRLHLESQFIDGMRWDNHGNGDNFWNIDHIRPLCTFDLNSIEEQKIAFHYSNLRPLWFIDNMKRSKKQWQLTA